MADESKADQVAERVSDQVEEKLTEEVVEKPSDDFISVPDGSKVYDVGESVVNKMNRTHAKFDRDLFFQDLYENWLMVVQRGDERVRPKSQIITRWDLTTSFKDFLNDALENIDRQVQSIKIGKEAKTQKFSILDDSLLAEAKIDEGSAAVGTEFGAEEYDAVHEILRISREAITDLLSDKTTMIINTKTGRIRITGSQI